MATSVCINLYAPMRSQSRGPPLHGESWASTHDGDVILPSCRYAVYGSEETDTGSNNWSPFSTHLVLRQRFNLAW